MSDFLNKYPYTDFHELNLDWVIERVKKLTEDWLATQQEWNDTEEQWQQLYNYVHDYFDNLDVQDEINNKINAMVANGTFLNIIRSTVEAQTITTTTSWLAAHITQPTTPVVDTSLTIPGAAADSKTVGDKFDVLFNYNATNLLDNVQISQDTYKTGYYNVSGNFVTTGIHHSIIIPVNPGDVLYTNLGVSTFLDMGVLNSSKVWIEYTRAVRSGDYVTIEIPDNPAASYLSFTFPIGYYPFLVVTTNKINIHYNRFSECAVDCNNTTYFKYLINNKESNDGDFFDIQNTSEGSGGIVNYIIGKFSEITTAGSWPYLMLKSRDISCNAVGLTVLGYDDTYVISFSVTETGYKIYRTTKTLSSAFTTLEDVAGIHSSITTARPGQIYHYTEYDGYVHVKELNTGIEFDIDFSKYIDDNFKLELGVLYMEVNNSTDAYYRSRFIVYPNIIDKNVSYYRSLSNRRWNMQKYSPCDRTLALRMLCDASGFYYIPFNAIGLGRPLGNGLNGDDYFVDQIHPTNLGGYNLAVGIWSYLKNIPPLYTSIPVTDDVLDGTQWSGKTWYAYGTSLTTESAGKWANKLASLGNMTLVNKGIGGGALVTNRQIYNALMDLTDGKLNADLITIEVGANDRSEIGEPYSLDDTNFCGALNKCLKTMFEGGVKAQIVIMNSYPSRYQYQHPENVYNVDHMYIVGDTT